MTKAAEDHTKDMGSVGKEGHIGTDGSTFFHRIKRHGKWSGGCSENISYGKMNGLDVLIHLLIDDGVPGRVHRNNIFAEKFTYMGSNSGSFNGTHD